MYKRITLKQGKDEAVRRRHPWVFSGAIMKAEAGITEGDPVDLHTAEGEYLATGHAQSGSIAVKLLRHTAGLLDGNFWKSSLQQAYQHRKSQGLTGNADTSAYRLVFGEGDFLPGLVIDHFAGHLVIQAQSIGMYLSINEIVQALQELYGPDLQTVYSRSADILSKQYDYDATDGFLYGSPVPVEFRENSLRYALDLQGQKTGFFCDQRENRAVAGSYAKGKSVLDVFTYTGGFSLNALAGGASMVTAVDSSKRAIQGFEDNCSLNGISPERYRAVCSDARHFLENTDETYDLIILDPPAFAKHHSDRNKALRGYRSVNASALKRLNKGGILFTFSCSQAIDRQAFQSAVMAAAIENGGNIRLIRHLCQPPDHPVSIFHPEGEYLKGLVLCLDQAIPG
ncbi:MAG TPA: class I SAM-dependent rRNA methyltransferase [Bacteroidales bacterium]|nr:class I SAM-dependent rRNA methyltransferase [Bacteroidales bacterium]HSA44546.1 class I SAM-dependent rRNA methyltransferase [Bacteroidales bacterium]